MPRSSREDSILREAVVDQAASVENILDPGVRAVGLMLTTGCNLHCAYCCQRREVRRTMAPAVLDAAIRQLVSSRLDQPGLTLFGGEPLLAARLVRRALDRARKWAPPRMKADIRIVTNGTLLDEEMTRLLIAQDVFITLSFDGVAPAQDDRSPGSFDVLDRFLVRLRRDYPVHLGKRLSVKSTLTSRNVPFLCASLRYFLSRGVRDVDVLAVLPDDAGWSAQRARELDRQLRDVVDLSLGEFRRSGEVPFRPFRAAATDAPGNRGPVCACGNRGLLFVDVDGTVAPCAAFAPSTLGAKPEALRRDLAALGGLHVTDVDLSAGLIRRERRAGRLGFLVGPESRRGLRGTCARCKARRWCFVCPEALACNGGRVPAFHCDVNRLFARHRAAFHRGIRANAVRRASRTTSSP